MSPRLPWIDSTEGLRAPSTPWRRLGVVGSGMAEDVDAALALAGTIAAEASVAPTPPNPPHGSSSHAGPVTATLTTPAAASTSPSTSFGVGAGPGVRGG